MAVGLGGLITEGLGGDLNQQLANALAGQGAPNPGAAPSPAAAAPGQAQAQTYAPDPQNANTIALLLKVHQQDAISNDLNRNIQGIAAGFGTAQQQASKQAALANMGPGDDRLRALGEIEKITAEQTAQNNAAQFKAGAAGMAAMFPGMTPQQLQWLSNNPAAMQDLVSSHMRSLEPTEAQKNADAAANAYATAKGYDPKNLTTAQQSDVANYKAGMLASTVGNLDPAQREMQQASMTWDNQNRGTGAVKPAYLTDVTQWKAHQDVVANAQKDLSEAKSGFGMADTKAAHLQTTLEQLTGSDSDTPEQKQAKLAAAVAAVRNSTLRTEGPAARYLPTMLGGERQDVINARANLNTLQNELSAQGMAGFSRLPLGEFNRMAGASTNLTQQGLSGDQIATELQRLTEQSKRARANIQAQAGKTLDPSLSGYADTQYFDPNDPYYSHATLGKGAPAAGTAGGAAQSSGRGQQSSGSDFSKMSEADADKAYEALPSGATFIDTDGKPKRKP
jgi:hypothetical protein